MKKRITRIAIVALIILTIAALLELVNRYPDNSKEKETNEGYYDGFDRL